MSEKERVYLTDITLHTRNFRDTSSFEKVAQKGRMFKAGNDALVTDPALGVSLIDLLPPDLQKRYKKGEIELMMPKDGLPIKFADDLKEKVTQLKAKARRELIHRSSGKTWHAKEKGVQ
ncbi:MAG: hypothetical protein KGH79_02265 [Patescibacteria group bacterium]|nr:hypothetical protein [Patescibacteria group bacterium]